jgi:hypothetical protein
MEFIEFWYYSPKKEIGRDRSSHIHHHICFFLTNNNLILILKFKSKEIHHSKNGFLFLWLPNSIYILTPFINFKLNILYSFLHKDTSACKHRNFMSRIFVNVLLNPTNVGWNWNSIRINTWVINNIFKILDY